MNCAKQVLYNLVVDKDEWYSLGADIRLQIRGCGDSIISSSFTDKNRKIAFDNLESLEKAYALCCAINVVEK